MASPPSGPQARFLDRGAARLKQHARFVGTEPRCLTVGHFWLPAANGREVRRHLADGTVTPAVCTLLGEAFIISCSEGEGNTKPWIGGSRFQLPGEVILHESFQRFRTLCKRVEKAVRQARNARVVGAPARARAAAGFGAAMKRMICASPQPNFATVRCASTPIQRTTINQFLLRR